MYFIFEGVDGVGKSTTMKAVSSKLTELGIKHALTKEPGGPVALAEEWNAGFGDYPFGTPYEGFRKICVDHPEIPQLAKRALFRADSIYNWLHVIKPLMDKGYIILSDRGWPSDLAYGTALAQLDMSALWNFNSALTPEQCYSAHIILLRCPQAIREARIVISNEMDKLGADKRNDIDKMYTQLLSTYVKPEHQFEIETSIPIDEVVTYIVRWIKEKIQ